MEKEIEIENIRLVNFMLTLIKSKERIKCLSMNLLI